LYLMGPRLIGSRIVNERSVPCGIPSRDVELRILSGIILPGALPTDGSRPPGNSKRLATARRVRKFPSASGHVQCVNAIFERFWLCLLRQPACVGQGVLLSPLQRFSFKSKKSVCYAFGRTRVDWRFCLLLDQIKETRCMLTSSRSLRGGARNA